MTSGNSCINWNTYDGSTEMMTLGLSDSWYLAIVVELPQMLEDDLEALELYVEGGRVFLQLVHVCSCSWLWWVVWGVDGMHSGQRWGDWSHEKN